MSTNVYAHHWRKWYLLRTDYSFTLYTSYSFTLYYDIRPIIGFTRSGHSRTLRFGRFTITFRMDAA